MTEIFFGNSLSVHELLLFKTMMELKSFKVRERERPGEGPETGIGNKGQSNCNLSSDLK